MHLSHKDYLDILGYYKIDNRGMSKTTVREKAEDILANKLCRCIKKVDPKGKDEKKAIAVCRDSVLRKKGLKSYGFRCKKKPRFVPKRGTSKNLAKLGGSRTRRRRRR